MRTLLVLLSIILAVVGCKTTQQDALINRGIENSLDDMRPTPEEILKEKSVELTTSSLTKRLKDKTENEFIRYWSAIVLGRSGDMYPSTDLKVQYYYPFKILAPSSNFPFQFLQISHF